MLKRFSKKHFVIIGALIVIIGVWAISNQPSLQSEAQAGCQLHNVSGWAWSETIGWISFSCQNPEAPSSVDFGVDVYQQTGDFQGYAWSENIGWISFNSGDTSFCGSPNATLDLITNEVSGWARALAGNTPESGGWDGCISLSDPSGTLYGVTYDLPNKEFEKFAWGDINVGWIDFNCKEDYTEGNNCSNSNHKVALDLSITPPPCPNCNPPGPGGPGGPGGPFSCELVADPTYIPFFGLKETELTWQIPANATCSTTNWNTPTAPSGSEDVLVPFNENDYLTQPTTYTIACDDNQGNTCDADDTVQVLSPPDAIVLLSYSCTSEALNWNVQYAENCTTSNWSANIPDALPGPESGSTAIPNLSPGTYSYSLTCNYVDPSKGQKTATASVTINDDGACSSVSSTTTTPKFEEI